MIGGSSDAVAFALGVSCDDGEIGVEGIADGVIDEILALA